jgi:hypothetical protein
LLVDADAGKPLLVAIAETLSPEQVIHDLRCANHQHKHLFLRVAQPREVRNQRDFGINIGSRRDFGRRL